ncbi:Copia protein [Porphyridium purpureum]|uniref:Copia protein n=1 Tax=Porphyridium purpureum TaxID=35688 RepID=A0A5J4YQY0_PORPP|nr:Copia protein [Porphyridium purpureum]|eukprot:POR4101..scf236_6
MSKRKATGVVEPNEVSKRARAFLTMLKRASAMHLSAKAAYRQCGAGALQAVVAEVAQMLPRHGKDVLHPVALRNMSWAQRRMIIPSHLFVKAQIWANGDLKKMKARLVAGGNLHDKSLHPDVSSPTASTNALFFIAALTAQENRAVASIDFPGAFLNAQMPDNPPTYIRLNRFLANTLVAIETRYQTQQNVHGTMICRLNKALYGTILAAKLWYEKLTGLLVKLRFAPNPYDACVWNREQHGRHVTVVMHVDDVLVSAPSESDIDGLIREIKHEYDGVERHRGKILSYVGMVFDFNTPGIVSVSMPGYVETVLEESPVSGRSSSPAGTNLFAVSNKVERLSGPRADRFHSLVCKLLYMAKCARPDLLTAVSFLSTRVTTPTVENERKLQRALRYLSTTCDLGVAFAVSSPPTASVDAAFDVHEGMTSHTGVAISLGRGAIFAKSSKQKVVAESSTEAELVAVSDNVGQLIWTRNFLAVQGVDLGAAHLLQDNMSTMAMIANDRPKSSRTRHMHIRHFFVTDKAKNGEVVVHHCPSDGITADILTKPLQGPRFQKLRDQLLGRTPFRAKQAGSVLKNAAVQLPTDEPHDEEAAGACIGAAAGTAEARIS